MFNALHHFEQRRRMGEDGKAGMEPYPHPNKWFRLMDDVIYLGGFMMPVFIVPQIYRILITKSAADLSPISWGAYTAASFFWFAYGVAHKAKPLIFTYFLGAMLHLIIFVEIIIYGKGFF